VKYWIKKIFGLILLALNIFITLDHNFWTWNLSRSSKVSKDSDCSLVSNKNLSEILPCNSLIRWSGPRWPKSLPLMTSLTKNPHPPTKNFFECRLVDLLHLLTFRTALHHLWCRSYVRAKPHVVWLFWRENPRKQPDAKVLKGLQSVRRHLQRSTGMQPVSIVFFPVLQAAEKTYRI